MGNVLDRDRQSQVSKAHPPPQIHSIETTDAMRLKIWRLRTDRRLSTKEIAKKIGCTVPQVNLAINDQHERTLAALSKYGQFQRSENNRQIEDVKDLLNQYIFNPSVVIRGTETNSRGEEKVVELSQFEAMIQALPHFLKAVDIQNRMWGLYLVPGNTPQNKETTGIKNLSITLISALKEAAQPKPVEAMVLDEPKKLVDSNGNDTTTARREQEEVGGAVSLVGSKTP